MKPLTGSSPENHTGTSGMVQAVDRAIDIFEQLASTEGELGISDISAATGLPAGTVHRLLSTLQARGYVQQNPRTRRYTLGYQVFALANRINSREGLRSMARPSMRELMQRTGETVNLAILDNQSVIYICQEQSPRLVRSFTEIGTRAPLHSTGTGKVLFAFQPPECIEHILPRLELTAYTPNTITDHAQLHAILSEVRQRGYALDEEEHEPGVCCVAAPILDISGHAVAALSISGPVNRLRHETLLAAVPHLKRHAHRLSRSLGHQTSTSQAAPHE